VHRDPNRSEQQGDYAVGLVAVLSKRGKGLYSSEFDDAFRVCLDGIARSIRAQYPRLAADDIDDVAAESVWALIERVRAGGEIESPGRWLFGVARNKAADITRALARTTPAEDPASQSPDPGQEDPDVAALIDALGDRALVHAAIRLARERGDRTTLRVAITWLELYERKADRCPPTLRLLGKEAEISHQGAADALERFRGYLQEFQDPPADS
jgi:DNA-directed RNA polymerase specialized sigma24 family protein